jgi:hypothetical protein
MLIYRPLLNFWRRFCLSSLMLPDARRFVSASIPRQDSLHREILDDLADQ